MSFLEKVKSNKQSIRIYVSLVTLILCVIFFFLPLFSVSKVGDNITFAEYVNSKGVVEVEEDTKAKITPFNALKFILVIGDIINASKTNTDNVSQHTLLERLEARKNVKDSESKKDGYLFFNAFCYISGINYEPVIANKADNSFGLFDLLKENSAPDPLGVVEGTFCFIIALMSIVVPIVFIIFSIINIILFGLRRIDVKKLNKLEKTVKAILLINLFYLTLGFFIKGLNASATVWISFVLSFGAIIIKALLLRLNEYTEKQKTFVNITQLSGIIEFVLIFLCYVFLGASGTFSEMMGQAKSVLSQTDDGLVGLVIVAVCYYTIATLMIFLTTVAIERMLLSTESMKGNKGSTKWMKNYSIRTAICMLIVVILPLIYNILASGALFEASIDFMNAKYYVAIVFGVLVLASNILTNSMNKKFIPDLTQEEMDKYMKGNFD